MGQELHAKGLISMGTLWSASANLEKKFHNLVVDLHLSYIHSGADVIITNTFSARRIRLIQNKVNEHFKYINEQACLLAIKAKDLSKKNVLIAGSLPSQSDTYVEDQRNSNEIEKDFLDQATIINPYIDFFYLDVLSSGKELDWLLRFRILKNNGLIFQSQVSYLIPIFGIILGYIFLQELITIKVLISLIAVCIGIYFVKKADNKKTI